MESCEAVLKRALMGLIAGYQRWWSPLWGDHCRFVPTCSEYARDALAEWGVGRGLALTLWRVLRCHPFCHGGWDPVPRAPLTQKNPTRCSHG